MRIVVLGSFAGSLVRFRGHLIQEMVAAGHEVTGCAPETAPDVEAALRRIGASYVAIPMRRAGLNPLTDIVFMTRLVAFFRRQRPDLLLCYTPKPVIYGCLAARLARVSHVFPMITGLGFAFGAGNDVKRRGVRFVSRALYTLALRRVSGAVFQNPDDLEDFRRLRIVRPGLPLFRVNGSGVDTQDYAYVPPAGVNSFLMISRLLVDKGVRDYVAAARLLRRRYPEIKCRLLGPLDPNPSGITKDEVEAWKREGIIDYLGEAADVRPYLADTAVFVLPSHYREGVPRVNLEAMAVGRPVITTDMPGCRETVVDGETGFLVPPKDPEALAGAMERFLQAPRLVAQMGRESRRLAERRFDVTLVNRSMLQSMGLA